MWNMRHSGPFSSCDSESQQSRRFNQSMQHIQFRLTRIDLINCSCGHSLGSMAGRGRGTVQSEQQTHPHLFDRLLDCSERHPLYQHLSKRTSNRRQFWRVSPSTRFWLTMRMYQCAATEETGGKRQVKTAQPLVLTTLGGDIPWHGQWT
jgi:hypothetical protein